MKVLLVDDEELQLLRLKNTCQKALPEGAEILSYENPVKAFEENKDQKIDIAFLDIEMPILNGVQLAKKLKTINPTINIIGNGVTFKILAVNGISDKTSCRAIDPTIVTNNNGLSNSFVLNIDLFSLLQFNTFIF